MFLLYKVVETEMLEVAVKEITFKMLNWIRPVKITNLCTSRKKIPKVI